jgi:hypothetical protein
MSTAAPSSENIYDGLKWVGGGSFGNKNRTAPKPINIEGLESGWTRAHCYYSPFGCDSPVSNYLGHGDTPFFPILPESAAHYLGKIPDIPRSQHSKVALGCKKPARGCKKLVALRVIKPAPRKHAVIPYIPMLSEHAMNLRVPKTPASAPTPRRSTLSFENLPQNENNGCIVM